MRVKKFFSALVFNQSSPKINMWTWNSKSSLSTIYTESGRIRVFCTFFQTKPRLIGSNWTIRSVTISTSAVHTSSNHLSICWAVWSLENTYLFSTLFFLHTLFDIAPLFSLLYFFTFPLSLKLFSILYFDSSMLWLFTLIGLGNPNNFFTFFNVQISWLKKTCCRAYRSWLHIILYNNYCFLFEELPFITRKALLNNIIFLPRSYYSFFSPYSSIFFSNHYHLRCDLLLFLSLYLSLILLLSSSLFFFLYIFFLIYLFLSCWLFS